MIDSFPRRTLGVAVRHCLSVIARDRAQLIDIIVPNARKHLAKGGQNFGELPRIQQDGSRSWRRKSKRD